MSNSQQASGRESVRLVVISAGVSDPSSTRLLADRLTQKLADRLGEGGLTARITVVDLAPLASSIAQAMISGLRSEQLATAIDAVAAADAIVAATPVYKAGISGLFKSFVDILDDDLIIAKPVALAATAGTPRHAMVVDEQMRPLFAFLRALPAPTSVFAATEDWGTTALGQRIDRVVTELVLMIRSGIAEGVADAGWRSYQHQFGSAATHADQTVADVDFGSDLMRLAVGGA